MNCGRLKKWVIMQLFGSHLLGSVFALALGILLGSVFALALGILLGSVFADFISCNRQENVSWLCKILLL
jgi:uncharacterized membrane protein